MSFDLARLSEGYYEETTEAEVEALHALARPAADALTDRLAELVLP